MHQHGITQMPELQHFYADGGELTGEGSVPGYDFNSGAQGWTFSNSNSGRVTSPSCGLNASTGGSIRTYQGSTYATSPVMNLSLALGPTSHFMHGFGKGVHHAARSQIQTRTCKFSTEHPLELGPCFIRFQPQHTPQVYISQHNSTNCFLQLHCMATHKFGFIKYLAVEVHSIGGFLTM